jgi:hypothetical protein
LRRKRGFLSVFRLNLPREQGEMGEQEGFCVRSLCVVLGLVRAIAGASTRVREGLLWFVVCLVFVRCLARWRSWVAWAIGWRVAPAGEEWLLLWLGCGHGLGWGNRCF